jgi:RNA polymerase sigma factor (sigma-70 family)
MSNAFCCIKGCFRPVKCVGLCASCYVNVAQRHSDEQIAHKNRVAVRTIPVGLMLWVCDEPKYKLRRAMYLYTDDDFGTLRWALERIPSRQREIIKMRYGMSDGYNYSNAEIGRKFNITRERVRQIEAMALERLAYYMRRGELAW